MFVSQHWKVVYHQWTEKQKLVCCALRSGKANLPNYLSALFLMLIAGLSFWFTIVIGIKFCFNIRQVITRAVTSPRFSRVDSKSCMSRVESWVLLGRTRVRVQQDQDSSPSPRTWIRTHRIRALHVSSRVRVRVLLYPIVDQVDHILPKSSRSWSRRLIKWINQVDCSFRKSSWSCFPRLVGVHDWR